MNPIELTNTSIRFYGGTQLLTILLVVVCIMIVCCVILLILTYRQPAPNRSIGFVEGECIDCPEWRHID